MQWNPCQQNTNPEQSPRRGEAQRNPCPIAHTAAQPLWGDRKHHAAAAMRQPYNLQQKKGDPKAAFPRWV